MIRVSIKEDLNVSTYLIEYLLAIIKITNETSKLSQTPPDSSIILKTAEDIKAYICQCAQRYEIIKDSNLDTIKNLINCYDFRIYDHKLIYLCNLLLLFKKAKEVKFVSETKARQTLEADEKMFIEDIIQKELFEHLKKSHKLEEYASLITWNHPTPPASFIYKKNRNIYTYATNNPHPISIDERSLVQIKKQEVEIFKSQSSATNHLYRKMVQKGFISPSPSRTKLGTKPACFIYDTLMFLGYFSYDYSIMNDKYRINKAKRDRIKELIKFTK